jgi:hypothetical protein
MPIKKNAVCIFINKKEKMSIYHLDYLDQLEAESIYILREVAGQFERPAFCSAEEKTVLYWLIWLQKLPLWKNTIQVCSCRYRT